VLSIVLGSSAACVTMPRNKLRGDRSNRLGVAQQRTNLNIAPAAELEQLPGIGKALAQRIVAHREQFGSFRRAEHLMLVRGISEEKFLAISSMVTVE
jgi:competence ComEA-like helix-hairpin-helix protein